MKKDNYPVYCLGIFTILWIILAIHPVMRRDWILENILSIIFIAILILTYRKFRFSNTSYTLITIFLIMHTIGSHYTYSEVPFLNFLWDTMNSSRNHYDRIVHFSFGLLLTYPLESFS